MASGISMLTPEFFVTGQISPDDIDALAARGFRTIVNNRPDGEGGPSQPTSAELEAQARRRGLAYIHLPIQHPREAAQAADQFAQALADAPRPVLAFCGSGGRAKALYDAARVRGAHG